MKYYIEQYSEKDLYAGLMILDVISEDVGILLKKYNVMESWENEPQIWAWDIIWTGPATDAINKNQPYTENGLLGMLNSGRMEMCGESN